MLFLDLETRSQCDLIKNGLLRYSQDMSTDVICMSYCFDDGPILTWFAEDAPFPAEVIEYFTSGNAIVAHNAAFERHLFDFVISNDYGFTPPKLEQWRCSSAWAMAHGLPPALGNICRALKLPLQKQTEGTRLIREYSAPGFLTAWKGEDKKLMQDYCEMDVATMRMICSVLRPLEDSEWQQYHITEQINDRGVPLDIPFVTAALEYAEEIKKDISDQLKHLTEGMVSKASERKNRDIWLKEQLTTEQLETITVKSKSVTGETTEKIKFDQEYRKLLGALPDLPEPVEKFLDLVEQAGGSTIAKYTAMANTHVSGRVHGSLIWNGAGATGRFSSRGLQLQNFRRDVFKNPEEPINAINLGTGVDRPAETLGRLIRSTITSNDMLTYSDYSQIEARVLPWLSADPRAEGVLNIFREGRDLYSENALNMFNLNSLDDVTPELRQAAKQGVLACLHPHSRVVTSSGVKHLIDVTKSDLLWDGESWVSHGGVIYRGYKQVLEVDGLWATQDHLIKTGETWKPVQELVSNANTLQSARVTGLASLKSLGLIMAPVVDSWRLTSNAIVGPRLIRLWTTAYALAGQLAAMLVQNKPQQKPIQNTEILSQIKKYAADFFPGSQAALPDVPTQIVNNINTMGVGGCKFTPPGFLTGGNSCAISLGSLGGITAPWNWIAKIIRKVMSLETLHLSQKDKTTLTGGRSQNFKNVSTNWSNVYDIANAGPNNRFTVLTDSGGFIVHNCGFGGGAGAVQAMAKGYGLKYSTEKANTIKTAWREANPWASSLWFGLKDAAREAYHSPGLQTSFGRLSFQSDGKDYLWMRLPSGRLLAYIQPRVELVSYPWGDEGYELTCLWGSGKPKVGEKWPRRTLNHLILSENATQGAAADIMRETIVRAHEAGLKVLFSVHDELVVEGECFTKLHELMTTPPTWSNGLPIDADTQTAKRYGK